MKTTMLKKSAKIQGLHDHTQRQPGFLRSIGRLLVHRHVIMAVALIVTLGIVRSSLPVTSAPITTGAVQKLTVYEGVAIIAPSGTTDVLELGNAGRDITGSGDLYFRPGGLQSPASNFVRFYASGGLTFLTVPGNVGIGTASPGAKLDVAGTAAVDYLRVDSQDGVNEGGELQLIGAGAFGTFQIDNFQGNARIHTLASGKQFQVLGGSIYADGTANNYFAGKVGIGTTTPDSRLHVVGAVCAEASDTGCAPTSGYVRGTGLCIDTDCRTSWPAGGGGLGGSGTLSYLAKFTPDGSTLGNSNVFESGGNVGISNVTPTGRFVVNNGLTGNGRAGDAIAAYANTANSAIYAENTGGGYAGYFSSGPSGSSNNPTVRIENAYYDTGNPLTGTTPINSLSVTGDVEIQQWRASPFTGWNDGDVLKVYSQNSVGATIRARNLPQGTAGLFEGQAIVLGQGLDGGSFPGLYGERAALEAYHSAGQGATWNNKWGIGIYTEGGNWALAGANAEQSIGLAAIGSAAPANKFSYAIYGQAGVGAGVNRAGFFVGSLAKKGTSGQAGNNGLEVVTTGTASPTTTCTTVCLNAGQACIFSWTQNTTTPVLCSFATGTRECLCK